MEIILVDDGSPDGCPKICDDYAKKDGRIRVIHQENGGLVRARKAGARIASGKYITFCGQRRLDRQRKCIGPLYELAWEKTEAISW